MGSHWWDVTAPELNGQPFTHTLSYGYYDGNLTFIEPMVTVAFLKTQSSIVIDIKQPINFAKAGAYPLRYQVSHSAVLREYSISLEGLTARPASSVVAVARTNLRKSEIKPAVGEVWCRGQRLAPAPPADEHPNPP
jgi:hypothetical protein